MSINSYNYEALTPDVFQMLVQALLVREYPDVQCYPVAMPDGGRDATHLDLSGHSAYLHQVKMAREPASLGDPFSWLVSSMELELPKIQKLAKRGYGHFKFICNIRATSHLDSGLMDRFSQYLRENVPITCSIWWRDDLDRRLDGCFDLKLRYPGVLSGPDIVRVLWESGPQLAESRRRMKVLDSYMRGQYTEDHTVRFKQIDLESTELFDLYIDVPIESVTEDRRYGRYDPSFSSHPAYLQDDWNDNVEIVLDSNEVQWYSHRQQVGGATFISRHHNGSRPNFLVVEGAPGQGKTTLTQYLVQLHRCRLLNRSGDVQKLPESHASSPVKYPFRLELRDVSQWLRGIDPWSLEEPAHTGPRTLEAAFAAHVQRFSGGATFNTDDFIAAINETPSLLILDALDEVADISDRQAVVNEIRSAVNRLDGVAELQVVVTSRPSVISRSVVLSKRLFTYLNLAPLDNQTAISYADKWASARRLRETTHHKVRSTLVQRISSPHIAELARNTMQLSILLNLIHMHGESLPSKRTEMYDNYVDLFFGREVEKNDLVREHRQTLERIHRFLGYRLHTAAEARGTGRVSESELRDLITDYLRQIDKPASLIDDLYFGIAERIVALVSRVEGTYEFEVQPLREYFAARYLYDTAPYSPPGREVTGTKPARFEGLARNPYWMNVTRFFAGCFSDGELLDLAERVVELFDDPDFEYDSYPLRLAIALLQDLVFNHSSKATNRVATKICDDRNLRRLCLQSSFNGSIPVDAGAAILAESAWQRIRTEKKELHVHQLAHIVYMNSSVAKRIELWQSYKERPTGVSPIIIAGALNLGILLQSKDVAGITSKLFSVTHDSSTDEEVVRWAVAGLQEELLGDNLGEHWIPALLERKPVHVQAIQPPSEARTISEAFVLGTTPFMQLALRETNDISLMLGDRDTSTRLCEPNSNIVTNLMREYFVAIRDSSKLSFAYELYPWQQLVGKLEEMGGGPSWTSIQTAVIAAGIRSRSERGKGASNLFDWSIPLTLRTRFARMRSSNERWWRDKFNRAESHRDYQLLAQAAVSCMSGPVFRTLLPEISKLIDALQSDAHRANLVEFALAVNDTPFVRGKPRANLRAGDFAGQSGLGPVVRCLIIAGLSNAERLEMADELLADWNSSEIVTRMRSSVLAESFHRSLSINKLEDTIENIHQIYEKSAAVYGFVAASHPVLLGRRGAREACRSIMSKPWEYPITLLSTAQNSIDQMRQKSKSIATRAKDEVWFPQD